MVFEKDEAAHQEVIDYGPPPAIKRRQLIFDSLRKITKSSDPSACRTTDSSGGTYVYTWGAGYHGQLGRKFTRGQKKYASVPQYVHFAEGGAIRMVACGGLHTAAVSDDGNVYTWGDGRHGQLGQMHEGFVNQPTPRVVRSLSAFVVQVACGQGHTVVLTNNGKLYSWGFSRFGQNGHGDRQQVKLPKLVDCENGLQFVQIDCGDKHSVALTHHGKVVTFGCGEHGQLGHGDQNDQLRPTLVKSLIATKIESVCCGAIFSTFITDAGHLHACGFGEYFYQNTEHNFMYTPRKMQINQRVKQVAAGQSHVIALTSKGNVYCLGAGEYGQLGHGVRGNLSLPRLVIDTHNIVQVAAGRYHSLALTSFGAVFSWGNNDNGQLAQETDDNVLIPRVVENALGAVVGQIGCGEHHTVAMSSVKWAKLGSDVVDWLAAQNQEVIVKQSFLKKTISGLGKKELGAVREEMAAWIAARNKHRSEAKREERKDTKQQVQSIRSRKSMTALEVSKRAVDSAASNKQKAGASETIAAEPEETRALTKTKTKRRSKGISKTLQALLTPRADLKLPSDQVMALPSVNRAETSRLQQSSRSVFLKESAQMVSRMTGSLTEREEANPETHMQQAFAIVCTLRKEFDSLKAATAAKSLKLVSLQREVKYMSTTAKSMRVTQQQYEEQLKGLEMQLDTVMIKINETEENRKNYELNIAHLKEEELDRFFQMDALRKQRSEINALYRKMTALKNQAQQEEQQAASEFEQFQKEIVDFHRFSMKQLNSFQQVFGILKNQRQERQEQKEIREQKTIDRFSGRIARLMTKVEEKDKESERSGEILNGLKEQISFYDDRFQRIASATGLENPDDIVNKFYLKEEIKQDLEREIQEKTEQLEALQTKKVEVAATLEEERNNFAESRWRDVDQLQEQYRDAAAKAEKSKTQAERVTQRLAFLQEGTMALLNIVARVQGQSSVLEKIDTSKSWKPNEFESVFKIFEERVLELKTSVENGEAINAEEMPQGLCDIPYMPVDKLDASSESMNKSRNSKFMLDTRESSDLTSDAKKKKTDKKIKKQFVKVSV